MHAAIWLLAATRFTSQPRGKACDQLGGDHLVPRPAARFLAAHEAVPARAAVTRAVGRTVALDLHRVRLARAIE